MNDRRLPIEILQFETLLKKPNSDPTGLAGFFTGGEIVVTRVPARLDVMGGISDYSGANVCEGVLGGGMAIALQPRTDRTLRIRTMQAHGQGLPVETRIPLDYFEMGKDFISYEQAQALFKFNPLSSWAAYVGGSIFTLLKGRVHSSAVWVQLVLTQRGSYECGHRKFCCYRDCHPVLPAKLPADEHLRK